MQPRNINLSGTLKSNFFELMKGVYTSIPGHIVVFNPANQRAQVQIGIQRVLSGEVSETPRVIEDVLVQFQGGDYVLEHEIRPGTEGAIFFSQRCIDGWKNSGGVAANPLARFHDAQDCYFVPGIRSLPNVVTGFANNGMRVRNKEGSQFVWLKNDGSIAMDNGAGRITIGADGMVNINGVTIDPAGNIVAPSNVAVTGTLQNAGTNVGKDHKHSGVQTGGGNTGNPI